MHATARAAGRVLRKQKMCKKREGIQFHAGARAPVWQVCSELRRGKENKTEKEKAFLDVPVGRLSRRRPAFPHLRAGFESVGKVRKKVRKRKKDKDRGNAPEVEEGGGAQRRTACSGHVFKPGDVA